MKLLYQKKTILFVLLAGAVGSIFNNFRFMQLLQALTSMHDDYSEITLDHVTTTAKNKDVEPYNKTKYRYLPPSQEEESWSVSYATDECGSSSQYEAFFNQTYKSRSRLNEDKIIFNTFFNQTSVKDGTFVEMGAYDGKQESNSRFYETCLGWTGLLIEGSRGNYKKVIKNRPRAHRMSFAPTCAFDNETIQFHGIPMLNAGLVGHAKTYDPKDGMPFGPHTYDVPCGPLTPVLLDLFPAGHINFFSLDVEGSEYLVLEKALDLNAVQIDVMMIEVQNDHCKNYVVCENRIKIRQHMNASGYTRYEGLVHASDVYVHPQSQYQVRS
mmetsp:Transcript_7533/g.9601  ORF Transcript_7533/g.9601 Transcript_7533/m.9601 type:complete len:326 (+) Transcript_7533:2-979(+)